VKSQTKWFSGNLKKSKSVQGLRFRSHEIDDKPILEWCSRRTTFAGRIKLKYGRLRLLTFFVNSLSRS
jgi:hypothetical protein